MTLICLDEKFSICKLRDTSHVDLRSPYSFLSVTDDEISLVCQTEKIPPNATHADHGWRALKIQGELDFDLIGIIAGISGVLAENHISIFVVSTYNTDYILIKEQNFDRAKGLLKNSHC